jgi:hypothetical protein
MYSNVSGGDPGAALRARGRGADGAPVLQRDGRHQERMSTFIHF